MSQSYLTEQGELIIPGAYPRFEPLAGAAGLAVNGVMALLGEADGGPDFSLELSGDAGLEGNKFGPDQDSDVLSKYHSGQIVDAFLAAVAASNDPEITGAPQRIIPVKTNVSARASSLLLKTGGGTYHTLADKGYGTYGNAIRYLLDQKTAEVIPTTGPFTYLPPIAQFDAGFRVNGGTQLSLSVAALTLPPAFRTAVDALAGVAATGGTDRLIVTAVAGTLALAIVAGPAVTVTYSLPWPNQSTVGDTFYIPAGSVIQGATNKNRGSYVVTAVGASTISATKLLDDAGTPGTVTNPEAVAATAVVAITDVQAYAPVTISLEAAIPVEGIGKALEIAELISAMDRVSNVLYQLNTTKVTWISKTGAAQLLISSSERSVTLRPFDPARNLEEFLTAGGEIYMLIGYVGTTATVTIGSTTITTTVTGGAGTSLSLDLTAFGTLAELASFINTQPGYTVAIPNVLLSTLSPLILDEGTFGICGTFVTTAGRIKADAVRFFEVVTNTSVIVRLGLTNPAAPASAGLPATVSALTYLTGGTRGVTTNASITAALAALEGARVNHVISLISRDASLDVADRTTAIGSTYTVDFINQSLRDHCNVLSTMRRRRNRQAFVSKRDTFLNVRAAAAQLNSFREMLFGQDIKRVSQTGIKQFQPWMAGVLASSMLLTGIFKGIVQKYPSLSSVLWSTGDFSDLNDTNVEDAFKAGVNVLRRDDNLVFYFASDQTTYVTDKNFLYNSAQAVYLTDIVILTVAIRLQRMFVGQPQTTVSEGAVLAALETILDDLFRVKWLAPSSDAPGGYKNLRVRKKGVAVEVKGEIKINTIVYFIPISFQVSEVTGEVTG